MAGMLTDGALERLHAAAAKHVGDTRVPGLVALVACGDEVHVEALGTLAVGGRPVARDSIFRIASTTKPITAAATLALIGEGLIGLDEPRSAAPGWRSRHHFGEQRGLVTTDPYPRPSLARAARFRS
jgi:CubicO group peptidase (beta-lactamase class C family)